MKKPAFVRHGERMLYSFEDEEIGVQLENIRETSDGLKGEITVELDGAQLHWGNVTFASTRSRDDVARALNRRADQQDWHTVVETCCTLAAREYRRGNPIVDLAKVKVSPAPLFLLRPLLPLNETTVLYGPGGSGKSRLSRAIALSYRLGRPLPGGLEPAEQGPVLILDWETNESENARDISNLARGLGVEVPSIEYRQCFRSISEEATDLAAEISARKIGLIIIDSLGPATGDDPNSPGAATRTMNAIRTLGGTRLVLAHMTKEAVNGGHSSIFGSVFFTNLARSVWELKGTTDGPEQEHMVALYHRKVNSGPRYRQPIPLLFEHKEDGVFLSRPEMSLNSELAGGMSIGDKIRAVLKTAPGINASAIAERLALEGKDPASTVRTTISRMRDVTRHEEGYALLVRESAPVRRQDIDTCAFDRRPSVAYSAKGEPLCETCSRDPQRMASSA